MKCLNKVTDVLGIEGMVTKIDLLLKFSSQLNGIANVLEVLESSFAATLSAELHDLHILSENTLKTKQVLACREWSDVIRPVPYSSLYDRSARVAAHADRDCLAFGPQELCGFTAYTGQQPKQLQQGGSMLELRQPRALGGIMAHRDSVARWVQLGEGDTQVAGAQVLANGHIGVARVGCMSGQCSSRLGGMIWHKLALAECVASEGGQRGEGVERWPELSRGQSKVQEGPYGSGGLADEGRIVRRMSQSQGGAGQQGGRSAQWQSSQRHRTLTLSGVCPSITGYWVGVAAGRMGASHPRSPRLVVLHHREPGRGRAEGMGAWGTCKPGHLEVMMWCIRHKCLENVESRYSDSISWSLHVSERKSAAIKRTWPSLTRKPAESAVQSEATLFIEDALLNLHIEQDLGEEVSDEFDATFLRTDSYHLPDPSLRVEVSGLYPFKNLRSAADILFLHGRSDMQASNLLPEIAGPETHPKVAKVVLERQSPDLALTVLRCSGHDGFSANAIVKRENVLVSLSEAVTAVRVRVECGLLTEAFMYQRMHCSLVKEERLKHRPFAALSDDIKDGFDSWMHHSEVLVTEICSLCMRRNLVDRMIELPWNSDEEVFLHKCLLDNASQQPSSINGSLLVVFYLQ
ncbi:hypothetical protein Taro_029309, partial [Colocasia esculenta]|nr:hypothetical protein [Colocasia esculenta]